MRTFLTFFLCLIPAFVVAETMTMRFVDDDGKPVEGIECRVIYSEYFLTLRETKGLSTDENGVCSVSLNKDESKYPYFTVAFSKQDFADGMCTVMNRNRESGIREFTIPMRPTRKIGGVVVDENGRPVQGMTVDLYGTKGKSSEPIDLLGDKTVWLRFSNAPTDSVSTDRDGRWEFGGIPENWFEPFAVVVESGQDYSQKSVFAREDGDETARKAFAGKLRIKLTPGVNIEGKVRDESGKPVAGVVVRYGWNPDSLSEPITVSEVGNFTIKCVEPREYAFVALSPDFAPCLVKKAATKHDRFVEMNLRPGKTVRFRFVDPSGKPVPEVAVLSATWRLNENSFSGPRLSTRNIVPKSSSEGRTAWNHAPDESVLYSFYRDGYLSVITFPASPRNEEYPVTIAKIFTIRGTVVDDETKKPVPWLRAFVKIPERDEHGNTVKDKSGKDQWMSALEVNERVDGKFEFKPMFYSDRYRVHVVTMEHEEYVTTEFTAAEGDVSFTVQMKRKMPAKNETSERRSVSP